MIADVGGNVLDQINYDSYGNVLSETGPSNGDRFKFTAREFDGIISIQFNRARYYDSASGRWISQDPLRLRAGDTNLYRYVENCPTGYNDPTGQVIFVVILAVALGAATGGFLGWAAYEANQARKDMAKPLAQQDRKKIEGHIHRTIIALSCGLVCYWATQVAITLARLPGVKI
jgi:RHS repeat-associated protein